MNNYYTMKATVLGWCGGFPRSGEATCSILVETSEGSILIDCGSGSLSKYFGKSDVDKLNALLISHLHYDHMADLGCIQYAINHALRVEMRKTKLPVYAPKTPEEMWNVIQYPYTETFGLDDNMSFNIAGINIKAKKVKHTIECYAFSLEKDGKKLVYFTDTEYINDASEFIDNADLLFCEATSTEGSRHSTGKGHISDLQAGEIAKEAHAKKVCLIHLPSDADLNIMKNRAQSTYGGRIYMPNEIDTYYI